MVLVDSQIPYLADFIRQFQSVEEFTGRILTNEYLREHRATAIFVRSTTQVNQQLLEDTLVTHVGSATAGTDHIDLPYLENKNITFADAAGSNAQAVSNYVQQALLALNIDLTTKSIGIIGFGNVGRCLYKDISGRTTTLLNDPAITDKIHTLGLQHTELDVLLKASNIITLHTSYSTAGQFPSHHLINESNAHLISRNTVVINCARGSVISEMGLDILIEKGNILVLDVWPNEPDVNPKYVEAATIATPHVAGHTHKAKLNGSEMMMQAYSNWFGIQSWHEASAPLHIPLLHEHIGDRDLLAETQMFSERYLCSPNAATFDVCRKNYPLPIIQH